MVDVCLLGCGGMLPLPDRWLTSMLFRCEGRMILIDCGEGTQIPVKLAKWGFKNIDIICITHFHADHTAGLPGLLLTMGNSGRTETVTILGPKGIENIVEKLLVIAPELPFDINCVELVENAGSYKFSEDIVIGSIPVDHGIPCLSYNITVKRQGKFDIDKARLNEVPVNFWSRLQKGEIIKDKGKVYTQNLVLGENRKGIKISYCTDTRPLNSIIDFVKSSDLFICEGLYGDNEKYEKAAEKKHMIFREAAELAKSGNVNELWLTHYSPALTEPDSYIDNARIIFNNTILGSNLLKKSLNFD